MARRLRWLPESDTGARRSRGLDRRPLDRGARESERAVQTLDAVERARAQRILRPLARARFIAARAALRTILGSYLQIEARQVSLRSESLGKPRLGVSAGLAFSLSHTESLAVIAVARRAQVGIDVESLTRRPVPVAVWRRVLDERELELVLGVSPARRDEAFLRHWTAKEAYVKAIGIGITAVSRVVIADALTAPIIVANDRPGPWSAQRFDPRPGFVGAVVAAGGPWTARRRDLTDTFRV